MGSAARPNGTPSKGLNGTLNKSLNGTLNKSLNGTLNKSLNKSLNETIFSKTSERPQKESITKCQKIDRNEIFQGNPKKIKRSDKNDKRFQSIGGETAPKI